MKDDIQIKIGDRLLVLKDFEGEDNNTPNKKDLEELLNITKTLQTKLANKDIQELQDSKNHGIISGIYTLKFKNGVSIEVENNELVLYNQNKGTRVILG